MAHTQIYSHYSKYESMEAERTWPSSTAVLLHGWLTGFTSWTFLLSNIQPALVSVTYQGSYKSGLIQEILPKKVSEYTS